MKVVYCGINAIHKKDFKIIRPHGSNDYLFLHTKAPTRFFLNNETYTALNNEVLLYRKGTPQYFEGMEDIHIDDFLHFTTTSMEDETFLKHLCLHYDKPILIHCLQPLLCVHQNICHEYLTRSNHQEEALDTLLRYFLIKLDEYMNQNQTDQHKNDLIENLYQLRITIYSSPDKKWTVNQMANSVNLSPSYLQSMYRSIFHTSCIADLVTSRMERAKHLLAISQETVNDIANDCGYESNVYFSRHFKTKVGMTPTAYRAMSTRSFPVNTKE